MDKAYNIISHGRFHLVPEKSFEIKILIDPRSRDDDISQFCHKKYKI